MVIAGVLSHLGLQQAAPSEEFIKKSPYYDLLLHHVSKLQFDLERRNKKITELTAELEVLRKERQDLETAFTVSTDRSTAHSFEILTHL